MTNFRTKTRTLIIAIMLAIVSIACFLFASVSLNQSVSAEEQTYTINYVDQAGKLIKTETTTLGNLSGADKEGYTANYSVVHNAITALPFQEIDLTQPILFHNANGGVSIVGGDKEFLDWYDINQPKQSYESEAFYEKLKKEWGFNQYHIVYENEYSLRIYFYLDNSLGEQLVVKVKLGENIYELQGLSAESSDYGVTIEERTYGGLSMGLYIYDYSHYDSVQILEINGITPEKYETAKALNEITAEDAIEGVITVRANYTAVEVAEPTPTPNEPTTDGNTEPTADKPNAFVSFFKDNANTLKTQFTALGNADFNTALTTGWQIYAVLGAGLIVLIAIITSIISALRPKKCRRR